MGACGVGFNDYTGAHFNLQWECNMKAGQI
jgi:hypothetical protein